MNPRDIAGNAEEEVSSCGQGGWCCKAVSGLVMKKDFDLIFWKWVSFVAVMYGSNLIQFSSVMNNKQPFGHLWSILHLERHDGREMFYWLKRSV